MEAASRLVCEVATDYTSLFGGAPQRQSGSALVDGWEKSLSRVQTHHLLGPIDPEITGAKAEAECHVRAFHEDNAASGGSTWEVLGHYRFELARRDRWIITGLVLETYVQIGNTKLLSRD